VVAGKGAQANVSPVRIAFVTPAYWPAASFGGPVWVFRALARELVARGHEVDVWTTTLVELGRRPRAAETAELDGARVHYVGTPLRFRWMGIAPRLPLALDRHRPDVVHVFGYRDFVGTAAAQWARLRHVPYVFEPLGMFRPKLRKVALKRVLDATVYRGVATGARVAIATSGVERQELLDGGVQAERIAVRPNGFPEPVEPSPGRLRALAAVDADARLVLSVGRVARGKGLELVVEALPELPGAHFAIVGPDGGHGLTEELLRLRDRLGVSDRVHLIGAVGPEPPLDLYGDADVFVLASRHENFGMVAAEAAAAGVPSLLTDRCGVAELLGGRGALVVPYERAAVRDALERLLGDAELRRTLGTGGREVAAEHSWPRIAELQEQIYRRARA
jgi:glycosyltransferase involved in cell wall biosynthesis